MPGETGCYIGVTLTSLALLISVSLNIILYTLRKRERQSRAVEEALYRHSLQDDRFDDEEQLSQNNPIYGNICMDGGGTANFNYGLYEPRTNLSTRQEEKDEPNDVSYASLDLTVAQKRKKKRKYHNKPNQTHQVQTHTPPGQQSSVDTSVDHEVTLPSRSSSLMVSRNSIYLNSHQVALEAEELERERDREREWKSNREREREIQIRNMHSDFDHSFGQSELSHEQDH
ncbi:uncharacterized protein [Hoplias malabaricus]|uniref:uncharacterized protein n=1 Tax=Hoplias malabaricus TaxID=27720 RepID=UPI0034634177